jgi:hypothetical protein
MYESKVEIVAIFELCGAFVNTYFNTTESALIGPGFSQN